MMSLIGNLLWIIFGGGIFIFLEYLIGGLLLCLTIIGIPFGFECIKLSVLGLFPFGKKVERTRRSSGFISILMNVLWILLGGIWIALTHLIFGVIMAITIIGIPFAKQHMKLASMALAPFATRIR
jgi:uncharacterized membrane protein YccF (DUF307 family)